MSSGEASGDHYTASVAKSLRKLGYEGDIWGMGGKEPREAGIRTEWPGEDLQLFGIAEVLSSVPALFSMLNEMTDRIMQRAPQCVIIADSPDFNLRLVQRLRSKGYRGKVFYISPPTVWAWRRGRIKQIYACVDECFPLFGFEDEFLKQNGCHSYWIGHPMLEEFSEKAELIKNLPDDLANDKKIIAFMPGSRKIEIKNLLPIMENTASELMSLGWHPVFSIAPGLNELERIKIKERLEGRSFDIYTGHGRDLLAASCCSVAACGTVAVESMMLGIYMVVAYKVSRFSAFIGKHLIKTPYYSMPNILLNTELFPELMQEEATSGNMLEEVIKWIDGDDETKKNICKKMDLARNMLGKTGVYESWAKRIMEIS
ncbi:MAG: lipid-A-disaccharide synthase [Synergistaceae bacterium]|nr:lipid-A-disaccharide synthase [Synergistaceae bacterium]